ncbi:breast carcinoma-amplified sequence 4 isoform X2 [Pseudophryne corroboree]|uniref:breast carcinoma-amplified sequence 4 isoform X2 n=1 Tax=Pseudophryne corroboree TaxID=495146 RepID=UPI00308150CA
MEPRGESEKQEDELHGKEGKQQRDAVLGGTVVQQDLGELQRLSGIQGQHICDEKMSEWQEWAQAQKQLLLTEGALHTGEVTGNMQQGEAAGLQGHAAYRKQNQQQVLREVPGEDHQQQRSAVTDSQHYAQLFTADASKEAQDLENSIEEMLIRLDEFCAMMDMIRNETSLILEEEMPAIELRVEEMNRIYCRVNKLEAFVKMVGHHVSFLEEEVIRAERNRLSFPRAVNRILAGAPIPTFRPFRFLRGTGGFPHFLLFLCLVLPARIIA